MPLQTAYLCLLFVNIRYVRSCFSPSIQNLCHFSLSFSLIYSKSQNIAVREVTGYKLDSPCPNYGEIFWLLLFTTTLKYLCIHPASVMRLWECWCIKFTSTALFSFMACYWMCGFCTITSVSCSVSSTRSSVFYCRLNVEHTKVWNLLDALLICMVAVAVVIKYCNKIHQQNFIRLLRVVFLLQILSYCVLILMRRAAILNGYLCLCVIFPTHTVGVQLFKNFRLWSTLWDVYCGSQTLSHFNSFTVRVCFSVLHFDISLCFSSSWNF
jgi:hypothetical protein